MHLGSHFPTYFTHNTSANPNKKNCNEHHYLNYTSEPREITISDHLPMIFKLSTTPFIMKKQKVYKTNKAEWDLFQYKLDSQIKVTSLEGHNINQIDTALLTRTKLVKNTMDIAIPKANYQFIYQLTSRPEIGDLEGQHKTLKESVTHYGWTLQT